MKKWKNANILQRVEVLSAVNQVYHKNGENFLIVTYPEALVEKVINKKSLLDNTLIAKVGENLDMDFIAEILISYDFEKTDFVYEPGQFAVRGGIFDIYSFSSDLPYRLEFFDDEIESIRTFNPETQLSVEQLKFISIIPNVQTKLLHEVRESFLDFIPDDTILWVKDVEHTLGVTEKYFEKVETHFESIVSKSANTQVISDPEVLFETRDTMESQLKKYTCVENGKRFFYDPHRVIDFEASPQPSFNKNVDLLIDDLTENQSKHITNIIASDSFKQTERLKNIFAELSPLLKYQTLGTALRQGFMDKNLKLACYTDHQIFERYHRYKTKERYKRSKAITLKELNSLHPGDYVTHIDYGVGRFAGMEKIDVNGKETRSH